MEVTALCIQIYFPIISPDKLQFFEYESFFISCGGDEDMNTWRVMRKLHEMSATNKSEDYSIPAPSCKIYHTFERHSGEYWCENDEGERSKALNISVTAGSVILEFTAGPVDEGSDVTLRCVNVNKKQTKITDFFKDGQHLLLSAKNILTLQKVSKSDEGFYKCSISGAGDSPESWLAVGGPGKDAGNPELPRPLDGNVVLSMMVTSVSLFLVMIFCLWRNHQGDLKRAHSSVYSTVVVYRPVGKGSDS